MKSDSNKAIPALSDIYVHMYVYVCVYVFFLFLTCAFLYIKSELLFLNTIFLPLCFVHFIHFHVLIWLIDINMDGLIFMVLFVVFYLLFLSVSSFWLLFGYFGFCGSILCAIRFAYIPLFKKWFPQGLKNTFQLISAFFT